MRPQLRLGLQRSLAWPVPGTDSLDDLGSGHHLSFYRQRAEIPGSVNKQRPEHNERLQSPSPLSLNTLAVAPGDVAPGRPRVTGN